MKRLLVVALMSLLVFGGCKSTPDTKPDVTPPVTAVPFVVLSGSYDSPTSPGTKITHYTVTETEHQLVTKFKRIDIKNQEPLYTIVFGTDTVADAVASWDDRRTDLKTYVYNEARLRGIEVVYNDRFQMQMQNLPSNHFYIEYSNGETYAFTLPHEQWQAALAYVLYNE
jgi:hypothetical protein